MVITEDAKQIVQKTAFLSLITVNADGSPYPIVAGKGEVVDETVIFGIYKMEKTRVNLLKNSNAWVVGAAIIDGKPKGYRFTGTAEAKNKQLIFTVKKIEKLI